MSLVGKADSGNIVMSPLVGEMGEINVGPSEDREEERTLVVESTALFEGKRTVREATNTDSI